LGSVKPGNIQDANVIYYHQEFDTDVFKPKARKKTNVISSYVNLLQDLPVGWKDFTDLENSISEIKFNSYGGQCRDGNMTGAVDLANSMISDDFVFHVKDHGDGYGHIIYNAYACGRPTIIRSSKYNNQLAQELFNDKSCIDLDQYSIDDAIKRIKEVCFNRDALDEMSVNAYETFKHCVDFKHDAERIYNWMGTL
jgi:hypothetical protein